jgi:CheY-like chemotaxis protein
MSAIEKEIAVPRPRALVVDDSKLACFVLGRSLERHGFDVELAHSAEQALEDVARLEPAVVFMDHQMSGMSGLEAVRVLRGQEAFRHVPVVMYTSQAGDDFVAEAREAGANGVLAKHSERLQLTGLLKDLGLPCRDEVAGRPKAVAPAARPAVASALASHGGRAGSAGPAEPRSLVERLEPVLREQREQIRTELLAEFALLENAQDSLRRQLLRRVDESTHAVARRLERELLERDQDWLDAKRSATRQRVLLAASVLFPLLVLGTMVFALFGELDRLQGTLDGLSASAAAEAAASQTASATGAQLLQRTDQATASLTRIEQRLAELPAEVVTTGVDASSYCLTPDGLGAYVLAPVTPGGRCMASAAEPGVQRVASLSTH